VYFVGLFFLSSLLKIHGPKKNKIAGSLLRYTDVLLKELKLSALKNSLYTKNQ